MLISLFSFAFLDDWSLLVWREQINQVQDLKKGLGLISSSQCLLKLQLLKPLILSTKPCGGPNGHVRRFFTLIVSYELC